MGDSAECVKHIELYVSSSATLLQQEASVSAVATLLKNDMLTIEALVREMEMYLTTTDHIIRSRGILLLAEVLDKLTSKPLTDTSIHSLIGFFSERLADWKALRGAIVGCLALLRRKKDVGMVTDSEAKAVALSYLQNLQVQALGQLDRKLSFQLMECMLNHYAGAIRDLGDVLLYGICEAIDEEKDPDCLLPVFHIIESVAKLYPDTSGPLEKFAQDLFEILGSYFPIHFTHVQVFSWIVALEKLQTCDSMQRRWPGCSLRPNWCCLCRDNEEDQDHLLLHCSSFSYSIWLNVINEMGFMWSFPKKAKDMFYFEPGWHAGRKHLRFWYMIVHCVFWSIWMERNSRIFEDKSEPIPQVWEKIKFLVAIWTIVLTDYKHLRISDLVRDWKYVLL